MCESDCFAEMRGDPNLVNFIERCVKCAYCIEDYGSHLPLCPSTEYFQFASYRPPGRLELARALIGMYDRVKFELNMNRVMERFYSCTLCGACDYKCRELTGKSPLKIFTEVRRGLVNMGVGPHPAHRALLQNVLEYDNPQGMPREKRHERVADLIGGKNLSRNASLLYFVGCVPAYSDNVPSHAANTVKLLLKTGTEFRLLPDEPCCSHVLIKTGQEDIIVDYLKEAFRRVNEAGAETVLFTCPACYRAFKHEIPRILGVEPDFECITAPELLLRLIDEGKLRLNGRRNEEVLVTYHDPCHLGRYSGIYDEPRRVLESLEGVRLVEMPRRREASWCCGVGGGAKTAFPDFSKRTAEERIREAQSTGASVLVTACPACESGFTDALKTQQGKNGLRVMDLIDIVVQWL
ncbi:MAG: (Fe-S)-binding protein [Candidatus Freyrarchaeum guaymaensis]